jgi:hypothetical protein
MKAILTGAVGSWATKTCPKVNVPPELMHLIHVYQGHHVIWAQAVKNHGWTWEGASFGGIPTSDFDFVRIEEDRK